MKERDGEEEINYGDIKKAKKLLLTTHNVMMLVMITLVIMSFFVGNRMGYIQGYSYVNGWYEDYVDRWCFCREPPAYQREFDIPDSLTSFNISNISSEQED